MRHSVQQEMRSSPVPASPAALRNALLIAAGAALAASALIVRQRSRQAEREHPPLGEFIEIAGVRLHYLERGEGPPLVFLHGNGSMLQDFMSSGLVEAAAKNHRVIVFDRPGYGYSARPRSTIWTPQKQAELLHRALLYLGVDQPVIVGHSWGTLVAVELGVQFPAYVKSLVLLSGYYYPTARADVPALAVPAIPLIGDLIRHRLSPWLAQLAWPAMTRQQFGPARGPEGRPDEFPVWMALRPSQLRAAAAEIAMLLPAAYSLRHRYQKLTMPVVIMAGRDDRHIAMDAHSQRLHQELPHSVLHVTQGAGHMLHHCAQQQILDAIEQAVQEADEGRPWQADLSATEPVQVPARPASSLLH